MDAAHAALAASAPSRKLRFFVFHCWDSSEGMPTACCLIGGFASSERSGAGSVPVRLEMLSSFIAYFGWLQEVDNRSPSKKAVWLSTE